MKNQYEKYKNPDGSRKTRRIDVKRMTSDIMGKHKFSLFGKLGKGSSYTEPKNKPERNKRKRQRTLNLKKNG